MATVVPKAEMKNYIGKSLEEGHWFNIDQDRINQFADVTIDRQFIHIDPETAKDTPFGSTIAHGFLTLSMLTHLTEKCAFIPKEVTMGVNYGFDKVRFINPVKVGSEVRAKVTVADVTEKAENQMLVKQAITVEIKGEERPALICEWLTMFVCA